MISVFSNLGLALKGLGDERAGTEVSSDLRQVSRQGLPEMETVLSGKT
jgi:hypothetical protein